MDSVRQTSHYIISSPNFSVTSFFSCSSVSGPFPISLQFRSEGSAEEPATGKHYRHLSHSEKWNLAESKILRETNVLPSSSGGSHETLRQPQEWGQRHQGTQMVCNHWLDCHLPEKGNLCVFVCPSHMWHLTNSFLNRCLYLYLGGSPLRPQVQRTRWHQQLWRLWGGGDPSLLHWEMCQGVCRVLELESERGRKKESRESQR